MQLTVEQLAVLETDGNLVINAVAGSGKTSTLIEYAKSRPSDSRILYLAFNRTVKSEATQRFARASLSNVRVETAHSLAFDYVVRGSGYRMSQGYKSYDWCEILGIKTGDRQTDFVLANHVNKFISFFCNSKAKRVQDLDYSSIVTDQKAAAFVKNLAPQIEKFTRLALAKMEKGEIEVTHDFYLKKFHLNEVILPFDYILFDEGQDASAAMLDVFLKQPAKKIIVGDMHQQIYGWRFAINSLQQVEFPVYNLSNSFRFDEEIALVANRILSWKNHLKLPPSVKIVGVGKPSTENTAKAVLGRTNLALLINAISKWQGGQVSKLYFEGNINSYTFADEGASLYDVLNLYNGKTDRIRDKMIAEMKSMKELEEYIQKTEDTSLSMIVEVVKEFGNKLPSLINELKSNHTASKEEADMIFSTVHRCKGMEYDEVTLLNDFVTEEKVKRSFDQNGGEKISEVDRNKLAEEINILYVAVTRARNKLNIPVEINPLKSIALAQPSQPISFISKNDYRPTYADSWKSYKDFHSTYERPSYKSKATSAGKKWSVDEENQAMDLFQQRISLRQIADQLGRTQYAVKRKLINLGMDEDEFDDHID